MMFLVIFENLKFLNIFDPQFQIFKNRPLAVEISADPKIWGIMNLGPKESSGMLVSVFSSLFHDIINLM